MRPGSPAIPRQIRPAWTGATSLVGDFNAYFGEDPIQTLIGAGYSNLIDRLLGGSAYSYNFDSQSGYLDHALNAAALPLVKAVAELHVNADEPSVLQALDSDAKSPTAQLTYYQPNEFAASDHDPIVIGFSPLLGDFDDDGALDVDDRTLLLGAVEHGGSNTATGFDRRMVLTVDGLLAQDDFLLWQTLFMDWQQGSKWRRARPPAERGAGRSPLRDFRHPGAESRAEAAARRSISPKSGQLALSGGA